MGSIRDDDAMENGCSNEDKHICEPENQVSQVKNEVEDEKKEVESIEMIFIDKEVPSWKNQLTFRAFVVSFVLGTLLSLVVMKLHMTTGMIPSLNIAAGLLGFLFGKTWTKFLEKPGTSKKPFTRQEYTMVQTCVVATCGIAFSGGFGSYIFAMSGVTSKQSMGTNDPQNTKNLSLGWIIGFLFTVSFIGLFSLLHFRKIMIIDYKLVYPSGTATAHLINSFYTPQGAKLARKQVKVLSKFLSFSFLWGCFQWFYTTGSNCGIASFPSLGFEAYNNRFYFNFSRTYVGVGMICSYITNISLLVGAIFSWGMMWPLIRTKEGGWYESGLPSDSLQGIHGYRVFITIAVILGDGLYNLFKVLSKIITELACQLRKKSSAIILPVADHASPEEKVSSFDDKRRTQFFLKDPIPSWFALGGYVIIASISTAILPQIFHQLKWYYVLIIHVFAPVLAFSNAYGCGLTDWSLASSYGKFAIFTIGAWSGKDQGGVLAGLAACGVMMNIVSTAGDLMQDFRTGYMTLASPRSMFVSQVIGTAMGCVISPCVFWLFYKAIDDIGTPHSSYPVPFALVYRNMAIIGAEGISSLPKNCLNLCYIFFAGTIIVNVVRDVVPKTWANYIPLPVAMAIPFYIGAYFVVDMFVGCLILFIWEKMDKASADAYGVSVASGLIVGDGLWTLPSTILALAGVEPPICMKFLSRSTNAKVDKFLKTSLHV